MSRAKIISAAIVLAAGLGACASMTPGEKGAAIGAATGAVVGSVVSGGSALGTVGVAAVGGVIGDDVGERNH